MAEANEGARPWWRRYNDSRGLGALLVLAPVCALLLFALPRPLVPSQLPSLRLTRAPVQAVLAEDAALAAALPSSPLIETLDRNLLEEGQSDDGLGEPASAHQTREKRRLELLSQVQAAHGQRALLSLRAHAVARFEALLAGRLEDPGDNEAPGRQQALAHGILGMFPNTLATYGLTRDGIDVAPTFVTRTLYKVRWNRLHGLAPDHAFSQVERRVYYGWQALHSQPLPLPRRIAALRGYAAAGGERVDEARGVLLFRNGEFAPAVAALRTAYAKHPSLRLRNYMLGAELVATRARQR